MAGGAPRPAAGSAAGAAARSNPGRSTPASSVASLLRPLRRPAPASSFDSFKGLTTNSSSSAARAKPAPSSPPVFDDNIFDAVLGLRPSQLLRAVRRRRVLGGGPGYDDVFATGTTSPPSTTSPPTPPPPPPSRAARGSRFSSPWRASRMSSATSSSATRCRLMPAASSAEGAVGRWIAMDGVRRGSPAESRESRE
ncbi:hypothetical protein GQ55_3G170000 [Panicum hallii var. hallii]|uniref:Uncharacterized protein n=1 Tax=Panicum hallii var. hallii TaxID=1504633 RepID=A0A2T7EAA8_9POAL|nr:hypothetical protein GQ55_3G170000 [Panicum hallii var. hallii]